MQMRKGTRWAAVLAIAAGVFVLAGCDDDPTPITPITSTNPTPPAPKRSSTLPFIPLDNPGMNLAGNFTDVTGPVQPNLTTAKVIQTVALFNHPDSCAMSADGKFLYVTNSGAIVNGITGASFQYYQGAISKLSVDADGRLTPVNMKLADSIHTPMGIAILPKGTKKFPAGSLFVSTGTTDGLDENGEHITDVRKFNPGVTVFDPDKGKLLGFIAMGPDRAVARSIRHPVLAPCGLCFDGDGNLYVADTGNTGAYLDPVINGRPGVLRIDNANIDQYADNKTSEKDGTSVAWVSERHQPAAVFYSSIDDGIYWTTCDSKPPLVGGVFRVLRDQFAQTTSQNILGGDTNGALMGVTITPTGNLIAADVNGQLKFIGKRVQSEIEFTETGTFASPADIKLHTSSKGFNLLYVPEQEPNSTESWKQRLRVVMLPKAL